MIDEDRLQRLFLQWQVLHRQGVPVSAEQLCLDDPELAARLRELIAAALSGETKDNPTQTTVPRPVPLSLPDTPRGEAFTKADPRFAATRGLTAASEGQPLGPPRIAGYEFISQIGLGGMGVVYKVRQLNPSRLVALKMVASRHLGNAEAMQRFVKEAQAIANLRHPHIVPLFEVGECERGPYFTMAYVGGGTLADQRERLCEQPREAVRIVAKIARAVQHAHDKDILHRDLKPSNILLDAGDEPLVCDFGLAKLLAEDLEQTPSGNLLGTVGYLSPEQASGRVHEVQRAADIWSLGIILYELLCGRRPFVGNSMPAVLHAIQFDPPTPMQELNPAVHSALERIALKCLQKQPRDRYQSAGEFAQDLEKWLDGEDVTIELADQQPSPRPRWIVNPSTLAAGFVGVATLAAVMALWWLTRPMASPVEPQYAQAIPKKELAAPSEKTRAIENIQPIQLVGPGAPPKKADWILRPLEFGIHRSKDDYFVLSASDGLALFELLPRAPTESFRLDAWLRHDAGGEVSMVGLYFGRVPAKQAGDWSLFYSYVFSERGATMGRLQSHAYGVMHGPLPAVSSRIHLNVNSKFEAKPNPPEFRKVAIEVRPSSLKLFWDGDLVAELSRAKIEAFIDAQQQFSEVPLGARPVLSGNHGLGLVLDSAYVSVKEITLTPLEK